ncbi:hypothetical protein HN011_011489 [Eciton burchellii]|nr:hypothetical protein HN011_011489 [Eciton burchellii]
MLHSATYHVRLSMRGICTLHTSRFSLSAQSAVATNTHFPDNSVFQQREVEKKFSPYWGDIWEQSWRIGSSSFKNGSGYDRHDIRNEETALRNWELNAKPRLVRASAKREQK